MKLKRILSILLSLCLILSIAQFPVTAATTGLWYPVYYTIENGVATITGYNNSVSKVDIPSRIKDCPVISIESGAFRDGDYLKTITIPASVKSIGASAFAGCSSLESITIPDSVTSLGKRAFFSCSNLVNVTISDNVTSIGWGVFSNCSSLTAITVDKENVNYCSEDGVLFDKDKTELIQYPASKSNSKYIIPNSTDSLGDYAFYGCMFLTDITIPNSVTLIGDNVFSSCSKLANVTISDNVTSIGRSTFSNCVSLTSVIIPNGVTSIDRAFYGCSSLTSITIPNSVTSIKSDTFSGCKSLEEVYYNGTKLQKESIEIGYFNSSFVDAIWHYFDNACDSTCNDCGLTRKATEHIYDDNIDAICNECGATREIIIYVSGDVNGDGNINNKDLGVLRRWLNDWDVTVDLLAADVNRDGNVNNKDLGILRRYLNDWDVELK